MNIRSGRSLAAFVTLATVVVAVAWSGSPARGQSAPPKFTECAFVEAGWLADHQPAGVSAKYVRNTPVPEGWTVVNGSVSTGLAILVCR